MRCLSNRQCRIRPGTFLSCDFSFLAPNTVGCYDCPVHPTVEPDNKNEPPIISRQPLNKPGPDYGTMGFALSLVGPAVMLLFMISPPS